MACFDSSKLCLNGNNTSQSSTFERRLRIRAPRNLVIVKAAGNTFGHSFRVTTFGESHGGGVGCVVDGIPARLSITQVNTNRLFVERNAMQSNLNIDRGFVLYRRRRFNTSLIGEGQDRVVSQHQGKRRILAKFFQGWHQTELLHWVLQSACW